MKSSFITAKTVRTDYNILIVPNNLGEIIKTKLREQKHGNETREWLLETLEHCEQDAEIAFHHIPCFILPGDCFPKKSDFAVFKFATKKSQANRFLNSAQRL